MTRLIILACLVVAGCMPAPLNARPAVGPVPAPDGGGLVDNRQDAAVYAAVFTVTADSLPRLQSRPEVLEVLGKSTERLKVRGKYPRLQAAVNGLTPLKTPGDDKGRAIPLSDADRKELDVGLRKLAKGVSP